MAVCDANYRFLLFDFGQCGSNNDSDVLLNSKMGEQLERNEFHIPSASSLHGCAFDPFPYFLVGDKNKFSKHFICIIVISFSSHFLFLQVDCNFATHFFLCISFSVVGWSLICCRRLLLKKSFVVGNSMRAAAVLSIFYQVHERHIRNGSLWPQKPI